MTDKSEQPPTAPDSPARQSAQPETAGNAPRRKRRAAARGVLYLAALLCFLAVMTVAGLGYAVGRSFQLPGWVTDYAEARFSEALPGASLSFERMTLHIEKEWHPRIRLDRVRLRPENGSPPIGFSEVETTLSYRRLIQRQVAPRNIRVSGVFLQAHRDPAGQIDVALGGPDQEFGAGASLDQLVQQIDSWLLLPQFERLGAVRVDGVTIQFDDLRARRSWTVDGGLMALARQDDQLSITSDFALLGGRAYASTLRMRYESTLGDPAAQFAINVEDVASEDIASQSPALAWLDLLRAPISGAMRFAIEETGTLGPLSASLQIDAGVFQPGEGLTPVPFEAARSYFTYLPASQTLRFDELSLITDWGTARAEGKAHLLPAENGLPNELIAQFTLTELSGNPAGLFQEPLAIDQMSADIKLQLDPFELTIGQALVQDQGQALLLDGTVRADSGDWSVALNAHMDALDARRVVDWWPERAKPKTRTWINDNIFAGRLHDINLALRTRAGSKPDLYLDFQFDGAEVRYAKTLPLIKGGSGLAVLEGPRFAVLAHGGEVIPPKGGAIDITDTRFVIPDTGAKPTMGEVDLRLGGTVTSVLSLLDQAPLNFLSKANLPVDLADGRANVRGALALPLVKGLKVAEVDFDIAATLNDVRSTHFVPGKLLSAPRLDVRAAGDRLTISGAGRLGAVPFNGEVVAGLRPEAGLVPTVAGRVELSERFVDEFNIGLSRELVQGQGQGQFTLRFPKDAPGTFEVTSDLTGIAMGLPDIGWRKGGATSGDLRVAGAFTKPLSITTLTLDTPGLAASGGLTLKPSGGLEVVTLESLRIGDWFTGGARLIGRGSARPEVALTGGRLDLARVPEGRGGAGSGAGGPSDSAPISAVLDRVVISEGISLTDFRGSFSTIGGFNGQFSAAVNGAARINGVVVPAQGRSAVRVQSEDAGGTFRAAGVMKQTYGGTLDLTLQPGAAAGQFDGRLNARNVRIKDAPAMAELLNAISVVGLLEQLGGDGILFGEIDAAFTLSPEAVRVAQSSAVGTSMGLSMDGVYDLRAGQFDMQGVISPVYVLNVVGRPIARKGEGLFGFNYRLSGTSEDPQVRVNPLSILTPGILRDIFRRPAAPSPVDSAPAGNDDN
ncbi:DUF3971 domain-containing protein [Cognatishimia sp. SS12]|uniref:YhdP family protein n=1 Tax=Cognatishimia sp. SS12 TaxID=2979465 RepID=UPI002330075A|nr:AsmA-like C-terminal region-containing protein [Cognatishimia sp. SS12]MDC0737497.1 DUF3971 domain-containing protein [Cognatishimia sp. SS12]